MKDKDDKKSCDRWYNDRVTRTSYGCTKELNHDGKHSHFGEFEW